jgi:hypothetical protein
MPWRRFSAGSLPKVIACGKLEVGLADRDDEVIVGDLAAAPAAHALLVRPHVGDAVLDEGGSELLRDARQSVRAGVAQREGLRHRHRTVGEVGLGREQRDGDAFAGEVAEGDQRLEGGDPAAGDQDVRRSRLGHTRTVGPGSPGSIRRKCGGARGELRTTP